MAKSLNTLVSLAASGTKTIVIPFVPNQVRCGIQLSANYATAAGTSGVSAAFSVSNDATGASYATSVVPGIKAAGASGVTNIAYANFGLQDLALRQDPGPVTFLKIVLTNTDASNAAAVAVITDLT